jgi:hypothetical protein
MLREVADDAESRAAEAERLSNQLQAEVEALHAKAAAVRIASNLELQLKEVGYLVIFDVISCSELDTYPRASSPFPKLSNHCVERVTALCVCRPRNCCT